MLLWKGGPTPLIKRILCPNTLPSIHQKLMQMVCFATAATNERLFLNSIMLKSNNAGRTEPTAFRFFFFSSCLLLVKETCWQVNATDKPSSLVFSSSNMWQWRVSLIQRFFFTPLMPQLSGNYQFKVNAALLHGTSFPRFFSYFMGTVKDTAEVWHSQVYTKNGVNYSQQQSLFWMPEVWW